MAGDWVKLHRKMLSSAVMRDDWLCRLWVWCLLRANFVEKSWPFGEIAAGSFVTGRHAAAEDLQVSGSKWYRGMKTLSKLGCISLEPHNQFTVVSICNWSTYQSNEIDIRTTDEQRMNNERTTDEQRMNNERTQLKNAKNAKKGRNNAASPPSGPHNQLIDLFVHMWAESHNGEKYPFAGAKDGTAAKTILKALGDDPTKWQTVFTAYFADADDFYAGHDLAKLASQLPRFIALANKPKQSKVLTSEQIAHGYPTPEGEFMYDVKTCKNPSCTRPKCIAAQEAIQ